MIKSRIGIIALMAGSIGLGVWYGTHMSSNQQTEQAPETEEATAAPEDSLVYKNAEDKGIVEGALEARQLEILKKGQVELSIPNPFVSAPKADAAVVEPQHQQAKPAEPAGKSNEQVLSKNDAGSVGTTHPAPFVDQQASASIAEKANQFTEQNVSGKTPIIKIGYHPSGEMMTPAEKAEQVRQTLSRIPDEWTIVYKSPQERVRIYVFTDTTCPYCAKLHSAVEELLAKGVTVHYLMYPRDQMRAQQGTLSNTSANMMNIWCSADQHKAIDDAFAGYRVQPADCRALPESESRIRPPVLEHFAMGSVFGVAGTPTIFASNGGSTEGFGSVPSLLKALNIQ